MAKQRKAAKKKASANGAGERVMTFGEAMRRIVNAPPAPKRKKRPRRPEEPPTGPGH